MTKLLMLLVIVFASCNSNKKKPTIIIDFKNKSWIQMEGDSIWWSNGEHVRDSYSEDSLYSFGHEKEQDTIFGIKNFKPFVIIKDNGDTTRYWLGDTVRFNVCPPIQIHNNN